jgi:hypothetical protein
MVEGKRLGFSHRDSPSTMMRREVRQRSARLQVQQEQADSRSPQVGFACFDTFVSKREKCGKPNQGFRTFA